MKRRFRRLAPALLGTLVLAIAVIGAGAAGPEEKDKNRPVDKVVMFAGDGMRPDLVEKYAKQGAMPGGESRRKVEQKGDRLRRYLRRRRR